MALVLIWRFSAKELWDGRSGEDGWVRSVYKGLPEAEDESFQTREQGGAVEEEERAEAEHQCPTIHSLKTPAASCWWLLDPI